MAEHWYANLILRQVSGYAHLEPRPPVEDVERYAAVLLRTARALKLDVEDAPTPVMPKPKPKDSPGGAEAPVPEEETALRTPRIVDDATRAFVNATAMAGVSPDIADLLKEAQKSGPTPRSDDHIRAVKERLAQQMPHAADEFSLAIFRRTLAGGLRALARRARERLSAWRRR